MLEANDRLELYKPTFLQKVQNITNYLLRNRDYAVRRLDIYLFFES